MNRCFDVFVDLVFGFTFLFLAVYFYVVNGSMVSALFGVLFGLPCFVNALLELRKCKRL